MFVLGLDAGALLQEILPGGQQLLRRHAQVIGEESNHTTSFHLSEFATKNQFFDQQSGGVGTSNGDNLSEQVPKQQINIRIIFTFDSLKLT